MMGGGNPLNHFEAPPPATSGATCYTQCVDTYRTQYPGRPMRFVNGASTSNPLRFAGEANIKQAILTHGPLYIAFTVLASFASPQRFASTDFVYMGANATVATRGGHAVVVYGWGTTTVNGVTIPYWKLINSWGGWGMPGTRGEFRIERGINVCGIESRGAWTIPQIGRAHV